MNVDFCNEGVICPNCGYNNKQGYRFCVRCGANLTVTPVTEPPKSSFNAVEQTVPSAEAPKSSFNAVEQTVPSAEAPKPSFNAFDQSVPSAEPPKSSFNAFDQTAASAEPPKSSFNAFDQTAASAEPPKPSFNAFEQTASSAEPPKPSFNAFEQTAVSSEPPKSSFNAFGQTATSTEPPKPSFNAFEQTAQESFGFSRANENVSQQAEGSVPEIRQQNTGFARTGFSGSTTPTVGVGAFATAVNTINEEKNIDISDAQTIMSLLDQNERSALAEGLPEWDIVPPQVVVRRKHRI